MKTILDKIKELATQQGCDDLQLTYSTKFGSKYGEAYGGETDSLEPSSKYISKTHRYERHITNVWKEASKARVSKNEL